MAGPIGSGGGVHERPGARQAPVGAGRDGRRRGASRARRAGWIALALVTLAACADVQRGAERRRDQAELAELARRTVELRGDLDALRHDVSQLGAAVDATRAELRRGLEAADARERQSLSALGGRLAAAERRLDGAAKRLSGLDASVNGIADQVARLEAVAPPAPRSEAEPSPRAAVAPLPAEALFDRAMESYRAGKLGQAALDLAELVEKYPADSLVPSARFWIAEAYFRTGAYRRAATEYEQAIALAPSGEQAPDALYRLGLAYRALKREDRARETWARLLRDHPGSGAAQKARRALDDPERAGAPKPADPGN